MTLGAFKLMLILFLLFSKHMKVIKLVFWAKCRVEPGWIQCSSGNWVNMFTT